MIFCIPATVPITGVNKKSVELYAPRLNVQALRKPLETDVGITAPRICAETIMTSLVSFIEVSQASYIQDESITPQYFQISWKEHSQSNCKIT